MEARLSDSQTPIENGRPESLQKRQMTAELYTTPSAPKQEKKQEIRTDTPLRKEGGFARMTAEDYVNQYLSGKALGTDRSSARQETMKVGAEVLVEQKNEGEVISPVQELRQAEEPSVSVTEKEIPVSQPLSYRIVGEAFHAYVMVEAEDRLLVIDKHAAHERILFEQLKAGMKDQNRAVQMLMFPIEVMLTSDEIETLSRFREEIEAVGFEFTAGRYTASVTAIPEGIRTEAVPDMLAVMAERIKSSTGSAKLTRDIIFEKALYQASCKAAIKAGREYPEGHIEWLVAKLMELPDITVCPHGRPVAMELTKKNLDHQFERS
jgi:DNA mismatch repair protein MutL